MEPENIYELIQFSKATLSGWLVNNDSKSEAFDPTTLLNSLIESEVDIVVAIQIAKKVITKLQTRYDVKQLTFDCISVTVQESILQSNHKLANLWIGNYDSAYGPDRNSASAKIENSDMVDARSSSAIKKVVRGFIDESVENSDYLNKKGLTILTNRISKSIRFAGFNVIPEKALMEYIKNFIFHSSKGLVPLDSQSDEKLSDVLNAGISKINNIRISWQGSGVPYLQVVLEEISSALLSYLNHLAIRNRSFEQLHSLLSAADHSENNRILKGEQYRDPHFFYIIDKLSKNTNRTKYNLGVLLGLMESIEKSIKSRKELEALDQTSRYLNTLMVMTTERSAISDLIAIEGDQLKGFYLSEIYNSLNVLHYRVDQKLNSSFVEVQINESFHELSVWGNTYRIRSLVHCSPEELNSFEFESIKEDVESLGSISVLLINYGKGGVFYSKYQKFLITQMHACVILTRKKFEDTLCKNEDLRTVILQQLQDDALHILPNSPTVFGDFFSEQNELLVKEDIIQFRDATAQIERGLYDDAGLSLGKLLELELRDFSLKCYSLLKLANCPQTLSGFRSSFPHQQVRNAALLNWLKELSSKMSREDSIPSLFQSLILKPREIESLRELARIRNDKTHYDDLSNPAEVRRYLNGVKKSIVLLRSKFLSIESYIAVGENDNKCTYVSWITGNTMEFASNNLIEYKPIGLSHSAGADLVCSCNRRKVVTPIYKKGNLGCSECENIFFPGRRYKMQIEAANAFSSKKEYTTNVARKIDEENSESKGVDILGAVSEALIAAFGPLAAPLKGLLEARKSQEANRINDELLACLKRQEKISVEMLEKIDTSTLIGKENFEYISSFINYYANRNSEIDEVVRSMHEQGWPFIGLSNTLDSTLVQELELLYGAQKNLFLADLQKWKFPTSRLLTSEQPVVLYQDFVSKLKGQEPVFAWKIIDDLAKTHPGSGVLAATTKEIEDSLNKILD